MLLSAVPAGRATSLRARVAICVTAFAVVFAARARESIAGPGDAAAYKGLRLAKKNDCVAATPLLEEAELARHRPHVAYALAGCYVALGELIRASELYHAVADEEPARGWIAPDRKAVADARARAQEVDLRIPTIAFSVPEAYDDLEVEIDGIPLPDPTEAKQVLPDTNVEIFARAKGTEPFRAKVVLIEGERKIIVLKLPRPPKPVPSPGTNAPNVWLGARFRSFLVPKFLVNTVFDGGATLFAPGGDLTVGVRAGDAMLVFSAGYNSFRAAEMPLKLRGTPDSDYEIVESNLQGLRVGLEVVWNRPIDSQGRFSFRFGIGVGAGWLFLGDLRRTQAFPTPKSGKDPYLYAKCRGPNDPAGTFLYCNQLDADAARYPGYTEPSWFEGGVLPRVYPFLSFPVLGLSWRPTRGFAMDLEAGLSVSGILLGLGARFGL